MLRLLSSSFIKEAVSSTNVCLKDQFVREMGTLRRSTVGRRAAKKAAGPKREGLYEYKPADIKTWSVFTGDLVEVKYGHEVGQQAKIARVDRLNGHVFLEGLRYEYDVVKRASSVAEPRVDKVHKPFLYEHVALVNPETKKACEVRWKVLRTGDRVRYAKDTGTMIPRPVRAANKRNLEQSPVATAREDARRVTYEKHKGFLKLE